MPEAINSDISTDKVLVIAGFGPGLGEAIAIRFADAGFKVVTLSRRPLEAIDDLRVPDRIARHFPCDLTDGAAVSDVFSQIEAKFGRVDCLVHNAMQLAIHPFAETDAETFRSCWEASTLSAFHCAAHCVERMAAAGGGSVIFTGATASIRGGSKFAAFASAKFALRGMTQALAREYGPKGVHVVHTILDGLLWSPQTIARFDPPEAICMQPEGVADTYFHLAQQPRSTWTHEIDLRPSSETF